MEESGQRRGSLPHGPSAANHADAGTGTHRCLQRHGISRLPEVEGDKPARKRFKSDPIGSFHVDIAEV